MNTKKCAGSDMVSKMYKFDGLTEAEASRRLDDAAERLRKYAVILVRDNKTKVPKPEPYEEDYK